MFDRFVFPVVVSDFSFPRNQRISQIKSRSLGPISVGDTSEGIQEYLWFVDVFDGSIRIKREGGRWQSVFDVVGVRQLDFVFDQSASPFIFFQLDNGLYIYWFDPVVSAYVVTKINDEGLAPFVDLDLVRIAGGDIVISYQIEGYVFYRLQRDRYEIAYPVYVSEGEQLRVSRLVGASMGRGNRFIFKGVALGEK